MTPARKPAADLHRKEPAHVSRRRNRPPARRPEPRGNPRGLRSHPRDLEPGGGRTPPSLDEPALECARVPNAARRALAADVHTVAATLALRAERCAAHARPAWPLADWTAAELELDARIEAGDAAGLRDAVAEALVALEAAAAAIDATLARLTGPLRHPVATPGRLEELAARAAGGFALFTTGP